MAIALVVLIDADQKTINERLAQLDGALVDAEQEKRQPNEQIAVFVPKRNIETWIHHLQGENVDEKTAYPKLAQESDCKPAVAKLVEQCQTGKLDPEPPPSLKQGCQEFQRILPP